MAEISVTEMEADVFKVTVEEDGSSTEHQVTIAPGDLESLPATASASDVIEASFRFLLDREHKESILSRFELGVIARYFPEYPEELGRYLR